MRFREIEKSSMTVELVDERSTSSIQASNQN